MYEGIYKYSYAGSTGNPLAHTLNDDLAFIKINGEYASEFLINAYTAAYEDVPVVFVSGDSMICEKVQNHNKNIAVVSTMLGVGSSVISRHPSEVCKEIHKKVMESLEADYKKCKIVLPEYFEVEFKYIDHTKNYKSSFYPGIRVTEAGSLFYETDDYFELLRMITFACM